MDRKTIIAFLLIGLITFAWMWRLNKQREALREEALRRQQQQQQQQDAEAGEEPETRSDEELPDQAEEPPVTEPEIVPEIEEAPLQNAIAMTGENLWYDLVWTNRGGCLRSARLKRYAESLESDRGVLLLDAPEEGPATFLLRDPDGELPLDTRNYRVSRGDDGRLVFTAEFRNHIEVRKEFIPKAESNQLEVRITFTNTGTGSETPFARYEIVAAGRVVPEEASARAGLPLAGVCGFRRENGEIELEYGLPEPETGRRWWPWSNKYKMPYTRQSSDTEPIMWAGGANRYFAGVLLAEDSPGVRGEDVLPADELIFRTDMHLLEGIDLDPESSDEKPEFTNNLFVTVTPTPQPLPPGESLTHVYTYFLGPKEKSAFEAAPSLVRLRPLIDYGLFGAISKILLAILKAFYALIPNYGVSIVLLTVLVKVCLHPFTRKSQIAMRKMQKLQPLIKELQEKHKGDRQKFAQAQMELLRKHRANPMGGCWPMFFQLPVFLGLFRMLQKSVELRHAGFFLWINDLSQPDTLTEVAGFPVNILPVLMVISWVVQSLLQPKSPDPEQARTQRMMVFMPVFFGFLLYNMASGLTLYWLTSTFIGILEQKWIKHQLAKMEEEGAFAAEEAEVEHAHDKPRKRTKRR